LVFKSRTDIVDSVSLSYPRKISQNF